MGPVRLAGAGQPVLAAAAAAALLPAPVGGDVGFVTLSLAGLAAPAALGLAWWSPIVIAGPWPSPPAWARHCVAARCHEHRSRGVARRRLGLAAVLGLYASRRVGDVRVRGDGADARRDPRRRAGRRDRPGTNGRPSGRAGRGHGGRAHRRPGAAATLAVASGASRTGVLGAALALAAFGVLIVAALRPAKVRWGGYPAFGVGAAALVVALASLPDLRQAQVWAAAAALVAVAAAATLRPTADGRRAL